MVVALDNWARSLCTHGVSQTEASIVLAQMVTAFVMRSRRSRSWVDSAWEQKDADAPQGGVGKVTLGGGSQMIVTVSGGGSLTRPT
ncbi:unannotated protein [freshwater metagenome]|uniref:Unannotated protein n=1 Tax=freshwater metagenome TaxID=449393 RepID=A0A6J6DI46_9ZZZZ